LLVLWADQAAGPSLQFRILQLIPVALASWYSGRGWGIALACLLPAADGWFSVTLNVPSNAAGVLANAGVRIVVLGTFSFLVDRAAEREVLLREVKILRGLLPICSFCKKIRTESGEWERIEGYIAQRSEADFTHGVCPECGEEHYGKHYKRN
jgi:hypothetical protein